MIESKEQYKLLTAGYITVKSTYDPDLRLDENDIFETLEALRAVAKASQQLERYSFGFPEVPEPECDGLSDALAALPSWLLEED